MTINVTKVNELKALRELIALYEVLHNEDGHTVKAAKIEFSNGFSFSLVDNNFNGVSVLFENSHKARELITKYLTDSINKGLEDLSEALKEHLEIEENNV